MDLVRSYPRTTMWALCIAYVEMLLWLAQHVP